MFFHILYFYYLNLFLGSKLYLLTKNRLFIGHWVFLSFKLLWICNSSSSLLHLMLLMEHGNLSCLFLRKSQMFGSSQPNQKLCRLRLQKLSLQTSKSQFGEGSHFVISALITFSLKHVLLTGLPGFWVPWSHNINLPLSTSHRLRCSSWIQGLVSWKSWTLSAVSWNPGDIEAWTFAIMLFLQVL